jgi:hypothetical protein
LLLMPRVRIAHPKLTTTAFVEEAHAAAARLRAMGREVTVEVIAGDELARRGCAWRALDPSTSGPLTVCSLLAGPLLTQ